MKAYDHTKIEKKWQEAWAKAALYETKDSVQDTDNFYLLVEFPYPSGNLHVGHWYSFAVPDILARKLRMEGKNVLYPIGFDAFGLPAENAAIKNKVNPRDWTESNIDYMRKQLRSMGASFDWSREVVTCHPGYYKWTQWLFLQLYRSNLVYRKETMVNWCPNDKTVLANEQVVDGKCERCGHEVIQKEMLQWNVKITEYADRLIDDLETLDWPEPIKESQRNWIGRSEGAEIDFGLDIGGKKQKFVILHGFESAPDRPRWIYAKQQLEALGHEVIIPALPNPDHPVEAEQVAAALAATSYDENTVLCGHSLGAVVALKVLEKLDRPIARLVTVGGFVSKNFKDNPRPFENTFTWDFDGKKIRANVRSITILQDPRDHAVSNEQARELSDLLQTPITFGTSNEPHFTGDKEPDVLMWLRPTIRIFTTRPDTLFGATFLVLAPEHPWIAAALQHETVLENNEEVRAYIEAAKKKTQLERQIGEKEKTGVELKGVKAVNPVNGDKIPLWVADYALMGFGTGALFGDAHDARDVAFAKKYDIPLKETIEALVINTSGADAFRKDEPFDQRHAIMAIIKHWSENKYLCLTSPKRSLNYFVTGGIEETEDPIVAAKREIEEETGYTDAKFVRQLGGRIHTKFYQSIKKYNRLAHFTPLLFELQSGNWHDTADQEKTLHDVVWIDADKVADFLNREDVKIAWSRMQRETCYEGKGILYDSGEFTGLTSDEAIVKITERFGRRKTTYKLRDWIVSRQRYWGVPIPIIHCPKCGIVPVPDEQLPVLLPETADYLPDGKGKSPLAKVASFVNVKCPRCGGDAERETDTLDTFVDSSWYFLRYTDPRDEKEFAEKEKQANWMPVKLYSGGAEHTTMHLLYSRFWHKALFDRGLVNESEPYLHRENHGLVLGPDGQKMSKSKGNVMDPDELVERVGSDAVRMYLAFMGPYTGGNSYPWNPGGIIGLRRFLERVWKVQELLILDHNSKTGSDASSVVERALYRAIKKVGEDTSEMKFNTAISQLMILLNAIEKEKQIGQEQWRTLLKLLAPFAPHIAEELWHEAGHDTSIHLERWPSFDPKLLQDEEVVIAIQIDGKTRDEVSIAANSSKEEVETAARQKVASRLEAKAIIRTIVVPNRLVNFVTEGNPR